MKFLCDNCKAKYQIGDDKVAGKTVRMKCRKCGHLIEVSSSVTESSVARPNPVALPRPHIEVEEEKTTVMEGLTSGGAGDDGDAPISSSRPPLSGLGQLSMKPAPLVPRPAGSGPGKAPLRKPAPPRPRPVTPIRPSSRAPLSAAPQPQFEAANDDVPSTALEPAEAPALNSGEDGLGSIQAPGNHEANSAAPSPLQQTVVMQHSVPSGMAGAFNRSIVEPVRSVMPSHGLPMEDWYVGIGGVPLGPVRLSDIREKALAGAVDGESLVWREGFDEWQPLKNFPELFEIVSAAHASRLSASSSKRTWGPTPSPSSVAPNVIGTTNSYGIATGAHSVPSSSGPLSIGTQSLGPGTQILSQNPLGLTPQAPLASPAPPSVNYSFGPGSDPLPQGASATFSNPAPPVNSNPVGLTGAGVSAMPSSIAGLQSPGLHPMVKAFIGMAMTFGGVAAWYLFKPQTQAPTQPQIILVPQPQNAPQPPPPPPTTETAAPVAANADTQLQTGQRSGSGASKQTEKASVAATQAPAIDTSGFGSGISGPSSQAPAASRGGTGGQLSAGEINGVVSQNQAGVQRKCWQPALEGRPKNGPSSARVKASIEISPSGNVQSVSASGAESDFPGLSSCIAGKVRSWKFPPSDGTTRVDVPFFFAAQ